STTPKAMSNTVCDAVSSASTCLERNLKAISIPPFALGAPPRCRLRDSLAPLEDLRPLDPARELHQEEEGQDAARGHDQAREAFEEMCVAEEDEVDELAQAGLHGREAQPHDEAQVADHEEHRDRRGDDEGRDDLDVVDGVREEQVEGEEGRAEEE